MSDVNTSTEEPPADGGRYKKRIDLDQERQRLQAHSIEQELEKLHNRYKLSEGKELTDLRRSQARNADASHTLTSRTHVGEESLLSDTAKVAEMSASMVTDVKHKMSAVEELARLQEQASRYMKKIAAEKKRTAEVEAEIQSVNAEIDKQRKDAGGVRLAEQENARKQRTLKMLEDKLTKARVKFNEAGAYNKKLRDDIDNLRRERVIFDGVYKRLERTLEEKKMEMAQIVDVSNTAYTARSKAKEQMEALKKQAEQEQLNFEQEWTELSTLIENDDKMKAFVKQRSRAKARGQDLQDQDEHLRQRIIQKNPSITKDKAAQQQALEKVQKYEEAFARIQEATGITDMDELVATFIEVEDQNFSLFNYVNELNNEVEKLEAQMATVRDQIQQHTGETKSSDSERRQELQELESQVLATERRTLSYETKARRANNTLSVLKEGIEDIFQAIGCTDEGLQAILGGGGVTETNMMQYLGVIEQRTNEILQMYAAVQTKQQGVEPQESLVSILGQGPTVSSGSVKLSVAAPDIIGEHESESGDEKEEEEDRPLTRQELQAKAILRMQRSETADNSKSHASHHKSGKRH